MTLINAFSRTLQSYEFFSKVLLGISVLFFICVICMAIVSDPTIVVFWLFAIVFFVALIVVTVFLINVFETKRYHTD